jgi:nitrite reductase/ring-hydroxylating ferredoxin subunit/uncharacterized membrane protein
MDLEYWRPEVLVEATQALSKLTDQPALDRLSEPLRNVVHGAYESAGEAGTELKNAVHGVWLGHPLHPVFTDLPVGAWTTGLVLDSVAAATGDQAMARAGDVAIAVGLAGAAAAAVTGLTDWSETDGHARRAGLLHGLLNITATALYATALVLRRRGARTSGQSFALAGYGIAAGAAWLGGDLVFGQRVGVTHAVVDGAESFTPIDEGPAEGTMQCVRASGTEVLVVRQHDRVCALAHRCSHLGGPLSEGTLKDGSVVCPWHGSEFRLANGRVLRGPATQSQPVFDVRERAGGIEVKARG